MITVKKLQSKQEMLLAYPLIRQIYKDMDLNTYSAKVDEMMAMNNYKMVAAFDGNKMVGAAGYWVLLLLYCGKYIQISNFVVDQDHRNLGVGEKIIDYVEEIGKDLGCEKFALDAYTENKKSHSLYFRKGFHIRGFHFMKSL